MKTLFLLVVTSGLGFAAEITGTLKNGSGDGVAKAEVVQLVKLGQGMQVVGTATNVENSFSITYEGEMNSGRFLLQAIVDGVIYTAKDVSPEKTNTITVFNSSNEVPLRTHIGSLAFYAVETTVDVGIFYNLDNTSSPPRTLQRSGATFSFDLPPGHRNVEASTQQGTMPLRQQLSIEGDRASLSYPLKPGRTLLMVRSIHDYADPQGSELVIPLPADQDTMKILSLPSSLKLKGEGIEFVGADTVDNLNLYEFKRQEGQDQLRVVLSGEPASRSEANQGRQETSRESAPKIAARPNHLSQFRIQIIIGVLGFLGIAVLIGHFRKP